MFELVGKVLDTAVIHHKSDLTEGKFILVDQFLDPFDLIQNNVFLQGDVFMVEKILDR